MPLSAQPIAIHVNEVFRRASIDATTATTDYLPTGFTDLDRIIHGLPRGGLTVLAGGPLSCKTILAANIVEHVAMPETVGPDNQRKPEPVLVFLTGISPRYYALKTMCRLSGLKTSALNQPQLDEATKAKLAKASHRLSTAPIYLCEVRGHDMNDLLRCASELHERLHQESGRGIALVVFDNLHRLLDPNNDNMTGKNQRISVIMGLTELAPKLNVAALTLYNPTELMSCNSDAGLNGKIRCHNHLGCQAASDTTSGLVMTLELAQTNMSEISDLFHKRQLNLTIINNANGPIGDIELLFGRKTASLYDFTSM
jgi:replicative DNA helicase